MWSSAQLEVAIFLDAGTVLRLLNKDSLQFSDGGGFNVHEPFFSPFVKPLSRQTRTHCAFWHGQCWLALTQTMNRQIYFKEMFLRVLLFYCTFRISFLSVKASSWHFRLDAIKTTLTAIASIFIRVLDFRIHTEQDQCRA